LSQSYIRKKRTGFSLRRAAGNISLWAVLMSQSWLAEKPAFVQSLNELRQPTVAVRSL